MTTVNHRTFDWIPRHDERSRNYSVREALSAREEVERVWETGPIINQGAEGACVGFAWTNEFTAKPFSDDWANEDIATEYAFNHYHRAREVDEFDDNVYKSGSSVLAGAKVALERGLIGQYDWCFSTDDVKWAVIERGPIVLGIPWYQEMYQTDEVGRVIVYHDMANFVGGHAITLTAYYPEYEFNYPDGRREVVQNVFRWTNSWGQGYGDGGHGYLTFEDVDRLLNTYGWEGEACVPQLRIKPDLERILDPTIPPRNEPEPDSNKDEKDMITFRQIKDVSRRHPKAEYILRAVRLGLMDVNREGKFRPGRRMTRAQVAEVLVKLHDKTN